jgi:Na+-transporting methylmalonyl-CoA/oxaloacetate decarboxylase gamma subunit
MTLLLLSQMTEPDRSDGLAVAATGLLIVFTALILISLFIASLPRLLELVAQIWPETDEAHGHPSHPESQVADDGAVLAAIGFVLHTELQKQLAADQELTQKS